VSLPSVSPRGVSRHRLGTSCHGGGPSPLHGSEWPHDVTARTTWASAFTASFEAMGGVEKRREPLRSTRKASRHTNNTSGRESSRQRTRLAPLPTHGRSDHQHIDRRATRTRRSRNHYTKLDRQFQATDTEVDRRLADAYAGMAEPAPEPAQAAIGSELLRLGRCVSGRQPAG
jgi:hypothetical protein